MSDLLEIRDLEVFYDDQTQALAGVSLSVPASQRVAIIGPNGAGKTSLLLAILGGVHVHGSIRVDGCELCRKTQRQIRSRCGMVFQDADDQLFMPTLLEDAAFGPLNQGLPTQQALMQARAAIAAVGLEGLEEKSGHHLSGGQKRAAALATVLSMQVQMILLDEPGSNLDFRCRRRVIQLLEGRSEAMLLATHDLDLAGRLCQRVVLLDKGRIAADGPATEILANRTLLTEHGLA